MRYQVYELAQFITCYKKHVGKFYHAVDLEKSKLCKITPRMDWMYYDDDGDDDDDDDDDDELCMWYGQPTKCAQPYFQLGPLLCKFAAYVQNIVSSEHLWTAASGSRQCYRLLKKDYLDNQTE